MFLLGWGLGGVGLFWLLSLTSGESKVCLSSIAGGPKVLQYISSNSSSVSLGGSLSISKGG